MTIKLNLEWSVEHSKEGKLKDLYVYAVSSFLLRGVGWAPQDKFIEDYSSFTSLSKRTSWNHLKRLKDLGYVRTTRTDYNVDKGRNTTIHIVSKDTLSSGFKKKGIKFTEEQLKSYSKFKEHFIRFTHVHLQNTFRFLYKRISANTKSLLQSGEISEFECPDSVEKVGCSIRKVCEYTGLSYSTVQKALKDVIQYVANIVAEFGTYFEMKERFEISFFKKNPKYAFRKYDNRIVVFYKLGSISDYGLETTNY